MNYKVFKTTVSIFLLGIASGCSTTYLVEKVAVEMPKSLEKPGIYYWLPKTEISAGFAGDLVHTTKAVLGKENFAPQVAICKLNPIGQYSYVKPAKTLVFNVTSPIIETSAVKDLNHGYRLAVDFSRYGSFTHTIAMNKDGIIASADSKVSNIGPQIALGTLTAIGKIGLSVAGFTVESLDGKKGNCKDLLEVAKALDSAKAPDSIDQKITEIESRKETLLFGKGLLAKSENLDKAIDYLDLQIAVNRKQKKVLTEKWIDG